MRHARPFGRPGCFLFVFAVGVSLARPALAHRPILTDDKATSAETAISIKDPQISQVVYREITKECSQVWLSFDVSKDFGLFVQIGVPVIDRLKDFRPAMAVVGPGLPDTGPPFRLPTDAGAKVLLTKEVAKPRFFHEPFTGTDSWILRSETVVLPKAGRYYLVAFSPDRQTGKLWLSVGKKESFGLRDFADFPEWTKKIRAFHELQSKRATGNQVSSLAWLGPDQESRFDLGQRLRAFETAWEREPNAQARARAVPYVNAAVKCFFSFRLDQAAQLLDRARFALHSTSEPAPPVAWATAFFARPETRLADGSTVSLKISLASFYKIQEGGPKEALVRCALRDGGGKTVATMADTMTEAPWQRELSLSALPEGDYQLAVEVIVSKQHISLNPQTLSVTANTANRLRSLEDGLAQIKAKPNTTQRASIAARLRILQALFAKKTLETNYPAARLLGEAEAALRAVSAGRDYFGKARPGEFWLTLADEQYTLPVRILAPDAVAEGKPLPLVVALHGAGGSENMFFDSYGNGKIVELCRRRGWLLVAPRLSFFGPAMPWTRMIAEIGKLYLVDARQVFVVGHSMGAVQAVNMAQQADNPLAAVAAVSGGGLLGKPGSWTKTAFFVVAGDQDFGLAGARRLSQSLRAAGASNVRLKEYRDAEHLGVMQAALPDVFAFFDEIAAKASGERATAPEKRPGLN
jgi:pimeloyl-ACP methyl ester carboxylesterase